MQNSGQGWFMQADPQLKESLKEIDDLKAALAERAILAISGHKQAEAQLSSAHTQLRQLLDNSPAVLYALKVDGQNVFPKLVSENITGLLGFTVPETLRYEWWLGQLHPEDRDRTVASISETLTQGTSLTEYRVRHKDGSYRWVEDKRRLIRDSSNQPMEIVGVWTDVTERKRAEEILLKTSRQKAGRQKARILWELAVIFGAAAACFAFFYYTDVLVPPLNKLVFAFKDNIDDLLCPPAILLLGFLVFTCRRWREVQTQVSEQTKTEEALRTLHGELEIRVQQRTAELAETNDTLRTEVVERTKAEETVRQSEERFRQLAENVNEVFWITDPTMHEMIYVSPAYEKIWGRSCESLYASPREWLEAIHPEDRERVLQAAANIQAAGTYDEEYRIIRPDETVCWIHDRGFPVRNTAGEVYRIVGTAEDITERKRLEAQFRQSQKMEGIGQLAGGVAHDFNNILAVIQMQSELLKTSDGLSADQSEFADEIGVTVQRASALTRQLLLFSRREVFQPRDLDLSESITNTVKMLNRILGETVQIQLKLASQPMFIHADAGMMDQVLLNLTVNARDAMPNGGQLVIETSGVEFDEFAASQTAQARPGSFVCLSVSDSGCGIPPEVLPKIFEPFFTTKEVGKGTGLGLATLFGIVQQHEGWVGVYSEVGHGTTFRIYLPRLARNAGAKSSQPAVTAMHGGKETILLAEDDPSLRISVRKILSHLGYRILEAPTGVKALEVWKQNRNDVRLLLTDLVMPDGMTGKELAQSVLQENPKLKVIYMSGYSAEVAGKDFPLKEGVNFLTKPFKSAKLAQTIRENLDAKN
jgi:two-component system, cell cycle sensor histidine kinase and response regulator CckA